MTLHLSKLAMAAFAFGSLVATTGAADAGTFHGGGGFHGSVHVGGGGGVHFSGGAHFSAHYSRPAFRSVGWGVRGGYYGGRGYAYGYGYPRYYNPYWYGCGYGYGYYCGNTEYVSSYYPVAPGPGYAAVAVAPRPELPRFGIGVFGGSVSTSDGHGNSQPDSSDVGLLARIRLTPGLILEGDLGKTSYENNERVDRRLGGSLIYEFGAYNHFAPYVLAGIGAQQADVGGTYSTTGIPAQLGIGLRYAFSPHLAITADIRAGSRTSVSNDSTTNTLTATERSIAPPTSSSGDSESYTRGQLAAIIYF